MACGHETPGSCQQAKYRLHRGSGLFPAYQWSPRVSLGVREEWVFHRHIHMVSLGNGLLSDKENEDITSSGKILRLTGHTITSDIWRIQSSDITSDAKSPN